MSRLAPLVCAAVLSTPFTAAGADEPPLPRVDYRAVMQIPDLDEPLVVHRSGDVMRQDVLMEGEHLVVIADFASGTSTLFSADGEERVAMVIPLGEEMVAAGDVAAMLRALADGEVAFARGGTDRIAGHDCALWTAHGSAAGDPFSVEMCFSGDGILLRSRSTGFGDFDGDFEVVELTIGAQDAALFDIPEGYTRVTLEDMLGASD